MVPTAKCLRSLLIRKLSRTISPGRHVITSDTCILEAPPFAFIPGGATLAEDRSIYTVYDTACSCEWIAGKRVLEPVYKVQQVGSQVSVHTWARHFEKSRNPESTGNPLPTRILYRPISLDKPLWRAGCQAHNPREARGNVRKHEIWTAKWKPNLSCPTGKYLNAQQRQCPTHCWFVTLSNATIKRDVIRSESGETFHWWLGWFVYLLEKGRREMK